MWKALRVLPSIYLLPFYYCLGKNHTHYFLDSLLRTLFWQTWTELIILTSVWPLYFYLHPALFLLHFLHGYLSHYTMSFLKARLYFTQSVSLQQNDVPSTFWTSDYHSSLLGRIVGGSSQNMYALILRFNKKFSGFFLGGGLYHLFFMFWQVEILSGRHMINR